MATASELDDLFAPIADAVNGFAREHSFRLEKYPRGNTGWELVRPHDAKGSLYLLLLFNPTHGLGIGSTWHFPCPEMSVVYSHFRPMRSCPFDCEAVVGALNSELQQLSEVKFGYWTHIAPLEIATGVEPAN